MIKMIKKVIAKFLDSYAMRSRLFQIYIKSRYWQYCCEGELWMLDNTYIYRNGLFYVPCQCLDAIRQVEYDYYFNDIEKDDIVLDIGANIGAFTMLAAQRAKHVYAVEPLFTDILKKNIEINNLKNITVFEEGLGDKETLIEYAGRKKSVRCYPLSKIIEQCGGHIDFLKIDCEGGEWSIKPEELSSIRRIQAEVHANRQSTMQEWVSMLEAVGFTCRVKTSWDKTVILVHAQKKL